jgi:hypothetical protein
MREDCDAIRLMEVLWEATIDVACKDIMIRVFEEWEKMASDEKILALLSKGIEVEKKESTRLQKREGGLRGMLVRYYGAGALQYFDKEIPLKHGYYEDDEHFRELLEGLLGKAKHEEPLGDISELVAEYLCRLLDRIREKRNLSAVASS